VSERDGAAGPPPRAGCTVRHPATGGEAAFTHTGPPATRRPPWTPPRSVRLGPEWVAPGSEWSPVRWMRRRWLGRGWGRCRAGWPRRRRRRRVRGAVGPRIVLCGGEQCEPAHSSDRPQDRLGGAEETGGAFVLLVGGPTGKAATSCTCRSTPWGRTVRTPAARPASTGAATWLARSPA